MSEENTIAKFTIADKCVQKIRMESPDDALLLAYITDAMDSFYALNKKEDTLIIDNRHYCIKCKSKRKQEFMKIISNRLHRTQWQCLDCNSNFKPR